MNKLKYVLVPDLIVINQIEIISSILEPLYVLVSCLYQLDDLALKSPRMDFNDIMSVNFNVIFSFFKKIKRFARKTI